MNQKADSTLNHTGIPGLIKKTSQIAGEIMLMKGNLKDNNFSTDSAVFYYRHALTKFLELDKKEKVLTVYRRISRPLLRIKMVDSAFYYINKAIQIDSLDSDYNSYISDLLIKTHLHLDVGETHIAIETLTQADSIAVKTKNAKGRRQILLAFARVYISVGEYEKAESYLLNAQEVEKTIENQSDVFLNWRKSLLYLKWEKYDMADSVITQSILNCDSSETPAFYGILLLQAGWTYLENKKLDKAKKFGERSNEIVQINRPINGLQQNYLFKSRLLTAEENYSQADLWIDSAIFFSKRVYDPLTLMKIYHQKSIIALLAGDNETANKFQIRYKGIKDSVSGTDNLRAVLDHEIEQTKSKLTNEVETLEKELTTSEKNNKEALKTKKVFLISGGILIFLIGFTFVIRDRLRKRRIEKEKLELDKKEQKIKIILESGGREKLDMPPHFEQLSKREKEVFELLVKGRSDKEISEELFISLATVRTHVRHIYEKFHIKSRMEAKDIHLKYSVL